MLELPDQGEDIPGLQQKGGLRVIRRHPLEINSYIFWFRLPILKFGVLCALRIAN